MTAAPAAPIRLRAEDDEDLKVVSACLQDAILPIGDMGFLPDEKRFVMVVNRFRWESAARPRPGPTADDDDLAPFERVHCGVRVEGITGVKLRGIDVKDRGQILELLSLETVEGGVALHFAGGGCVRLDGAGWRLLVEDLGEPWPTGCKPSHVLEG
ncbi:hypothetical protein J2847_004686 [Azospirillum agricola]|uniref:DUF2948 family protein n=1 Tax=Azospirillum agricola TaxID=1720247 RepID=UPI001AE133A2|nr:DUF2948 family protein [Azospirillum agricola]MBP2231374.1 hypothetical protein [Azospirillum agricola]